MFCAVQLPHLLQTCAPLAGWQCAQQRGRCFQPAKPVWPLTTRIPIRTSPGVLIACGHQVAASLNPVACSSRRKGADGESLGEPFMGLLGREGDRVLVCLTQNALKWPKVNLQQISPEDTNSNRGDRAGSQRVRPRRAAGCCKGRCWGRHVPAQGQT